MQTTTATTNKSKLSIKQGPGGDRSLSHLPLYSIKDEEIHQMKNIVQEPDSTQPKNRKHISSAVCLKDSKKNNRPVKEQLMSLLDGLTILKKVPPRVKNNKTSLMVRPPFK